MFVRFRCVRHVAAAVSMCVVAGCGFVSESASGADQEIAVGTTSAPSTLDPAASWDGSWELFRNVYQTLLSYPAGASEPEPDAARCAFTDESMRSYSCTLKEGLRFSDGDSLDAHAVKHSIDRIVRINVPGGPKGLLGSLDRVETRGERTVVFHLSQPDATFPLVLATPAMSIVDPREYPADALRTEQEVTGSGPYALAAYEEGRRARLVRNGHYRGSAQRKNDEVTIRYFQDSASMVQALHDKEIDVTYRGLAAEDVIALQSNDPDDGVQLVEGAGTEISYLVFNPEDRWARKSAVRRAVAQIIDRSALAHKVYKDTVDPLYSMIPSGLPGHTTGYFDDFGDPDPDRAAELLADAGIVEPVPLDLWFTTDRYGSMTEPAFREIESQLEESGLFEVTLKSRAWKTYEAGYRRGEYPVFGRGWFPDFPDPENFIAPFVGERNALGTPYPVPEITSVLLPRSRREADRSAVAADFERAQQILVDDARLLPLWQGRQYVAASEEISGSERSLDPSTVMLLWELHRKTSW
ncbi:ABC transporter substrate-binding protein [Streptomyces sp. NPDC059578]|uniref:ABC transporter substrate-binding protein n=1 Tax=Streptomyces sp. NPDC059578 TaxID=3346874 RepID=UPI003674C54B